LTKSDDLIESYYTRREWMVRVKKSYCDFDSFIMYMFDLYNVIKFKNQMKRYFVLKGQKKYGRAMEVIETEIDYCYVSLNNMITNNCIIEHRESDFKKEKSMVNQRINVILSKRK